MEILVQIESTLASIGHNISTALKNIHINYYLYLVNELLERERKRERERESERERERKRERDGA